MHGYQAFTRCTPGTCRRGVRLGAALARLPSCLPEAADYP